MEMAWGSEPPDVAGGYESDLFNLTVDQVPDLLNKSLVSPQKSMAVSIRVIITLLYAFGISGNISALYIILTSDSRYKKQTLMLSSLICNDLTALLGSLVMMNVGYFVPQADPKCLCVFRVMWRSFGLGSGCIAVVMALERWLALTHPFLYQKHITHELIRRTIVFLWLCNALLVCAPFVGFGLWYDEKRIDGQCVRYRFGTTPIDSLYAYVMFAFGISMCICIVCCNMSVVRVLCKMGDRVLTRRYTRNSNRSITPGGLEPPCNNHTPEELSFARLMAVLSIFFVVCWCPQLLTILASQITNTHKEKTFVDKIADLLIALNFTLDPYLYVLFRQRKNPRRNTLPRLFSKLCPAKNVNRSSSSRIILSVSGQENKLLQHSGKETSSSHFTLEREYVPLRLLIDTPGGKEKRTTKFCSSLSSLSDKLWSRNPLIDEIAVKSHSAEA